MGDMMDSEYMEEWINMTLKPRELDTAFTGVTPQNLSIGPGLVQLIINLCEELDYTAEVEFTALDTFDRYWAGYSQGIISDFEDAFKQPANDVDGSIIASQLWTKQMNNIQQTVLCKVLTVLMLSAKFVGNGHRRRARNHFKTIADFIKNSNLPEPSLKEMQSSEAEVTLALGHMRSSIVYVAVQTFIFVGSEQLKMVKISIDDLCRLTEMFLRVVYAEREQIGLKAVEKQCAEKVEELTTVNSSVLTGVGCNLLAAAIVLCGLVRVELSMEFCKNYGEIMAKQIESVERLQLEKAMVLMEIINEALQSNDDDDASDAAEIDM